MVPARRRRGTRWTTLAPARLTLLSPFDNLICDRARTEALWDFEFRLEIYTPAAQRRWGYYVLPVLDGDRLVGRVDAATDPGRELLVAKAVHREDGVRWGARRTPRAAPPIRGPGPVRRRRRRGRSDRQPRARLTVGRRSGLASLGLGREIDAADADLGLEQVAA